MVYYTWLLDTLEHERDRHNMRRIWSILTLHPSSTWSICLMLSCNNPTWHLVQWQWQSSSSLQLIYYVIVIKLWHTLQHGSLWQMQHCVGQPFLSSYNDAWPWFLWYVQVLELSTLEILHGKCGNAAQTGRWGRSCKTRRVTQHTTVHSNSNHISVSKIMSMSKGFCHIHGLQYTNLLKHPEQSFSHRGGNHH